LKMPESPEQNRGGVECWFLDVGQGTSNVVLLGGGRAIVVDCGRRNSGVPLALLKRYVYTIEVLIVSHNDSDHDGGIARILEAYPKAIRRLLFLADRDAPLIRTFILAKRERAAGNLLCEPERLEAKENPQTVFSDVGAQVELKLLHPTFVENLSALSGERPNQASGVLALFCGARCVVFSGDATMLAWEALASRLSSFLPLHCDVMTVPHHGGYLTARRSGEARDSYERRAQEDLRRLYGHIVRPSVAVVSVGSSNRFRDVIHPTPGGIAALRASDVQVICTQMTPNCCDDLECVRPGLLSPASPSQSSANLKITSRGRSRDVACAGSVVAEITPDQVRISILEDHRRAIKKATDAGTIRPMCYASS